MNTFLLLIIGVPIIEIYLFIKLGSQIGAFNTILLIFITAFFGIVYARYEGFNTLRSGMSQIVKNELPVYEIISGAALAFAALLLILPGFATDLLGLLIIFPPTRKLIFKKVSIKQKPINKKRLEEWANIENIPLGSETKKYYERNKKLIDLGEIPGLIYNDILNKYKTYTVPSRSLLLTYFIENKLKSLIENINDF